jgi:hypothetical protein
VNGDQVAKATLPEIWEAFEEATDTDTANLALGQSLRYLSMDMVNMNDDTADILDELLEELRTLEI